MSSTPLVEARASGQNLPISFKFACEICTFIRGRPVATVRRQLQDAVELRRPIPFRRFTWDLCHKAGKLGPARFPVNTAKMFLLLLDSATKNAKSLGLSEDLMVSFAVAGQGAGRWHAGRKRRRRMKRAHVEIHLRPSSSEGVSA